MPDSTQLLEEIRKIFTFQTVYQGTRFECKGVRIMDTNPEDIEDVYVIDVEIFDEEKHTSEVFSGSVRIPKITRGSVSIKGKTKQGIYIALGNLQIRIFGGIVAWGHAYSSDQAFDLSLRNNTFVLKAPYNPETKTMEIIAEGTASNFLKYFNAWDESFIPRIPWDSYKDSLGLMDSEIEQFKKIEEVAIIPEGALKKLKFLSKNPYLTNRFNEDSVNAIAHILKNDTIYASQPTPMDYTFLDTYEALATSISRFDKILKIRRDVSFKYRQQGGFYTSSLQNVINDFFKGTDSEYNNIQEFTDSNALSVEAQNSKVYFKKYNKEAKGFVKERLNPTFFVGIIDPVFTADGNNVNIKNEMSKNAKIIGGKVYVELYDKKFREVTVEAYDYLMSKTLSSDNVDYITKTTKPINGKYTVYQYGEYESVTDISDIKYIRKQDSILTASTAMIPFINKTQAMRGIDY